MYLCIIVLLAASLYSSQVQASDFVVLFVGLGALLIGALNVGLGCWAFACARKKGRREGLPMIGIIVFLSFVGVGIVMDEAGHMPDTQTAALLATVLIPGIVALIALLLVRKAEVRDTE